MSKDASPEPGLIKSIFERKKKTPVAAEKVSALFGAGGGRGPKGETQLESKRLPREFLPVGIDIGSSQIKIIQLAKNDGQLQLVKISSKPSNEVKGTVRDLAQENNLKGEAVIGLSAKEVQIRFLKLPAMPSSEIDGAIRWEIGQTLKVNPRRMDDYCLDYEILGDSTSENKVLVAIVSKDVVFKKMKEVSDAGLNVLAAEPSPLALFAGLCYFSPPNEENVTLLLDIGCDLSSLTIAIGQEAYLVQNIATTGNFFTEAIRTYFQIEHKDAEELKCQYGLEDWTSIPEALTKTGRASERQDVNSLKGTLASSLENLVVDIEHSYKHLYNQLPSSSERALSRIIISGGGGKLKGLDSFLRSRFNIPVEVFDPLSGLIIDEDIKNKVNLKEIGATFGVAAGLALRGAQ